MIHFIFSFSISEVPHPTQNLSGDTEAVAVFLGHRHHDRYYSFSDHFDAARFRPSSFLTPPKIVPNETHHTKQ